MLKGIDVSHYQGDIDWQKVAASGVSFAYIKHSQGLQVDPKFEVNVAQASMAGIKVGAYLFQVESFPLVDQLTLFCTSAGKLDLPPALDAERIGIQAKDVCVALGWIKEALGAAVMYSNFWLLSEWLAEEPTLASYPLWIAEYGSRTAPKLPAYSRNQQSVRWDDWAFWQYSGSGSCDGVQTKIDLDFFNGDEAALEALCATVKHEEHGPYGASD